MHYFSKVTTISPDCTIVLLIKVGYIKILLFKKHLCGTRLKKKKATYDITPGQRTYVVKTHSESAQEFQDVEECWLSLTLL
jgi:hypothetical protein